MAGAGDCPKKDHNTALGPYQRRAAAKPVIKTYRPTLLFFCGSRECASRQRGRFLCRLREIAMRYSIVRGGGLLYSACAMRCIKLVCRNKKWGFFIMVYISILLISFGASAIGAVTGIGGGVIINPLMDALFDMGVATVSFLSGCTVLAMSSVSLVSNIKNKTRIDVKKSSLLAAGAVAGGAAGKAVFDYFMRYMESGDDVGAVQSAVLIIITAGVFVYTCLKKRIAAKSVEQPAGCVAIGLALGVMSSFLGIGGGPINIAVLAYFFSMDSKTAAANSLYIIFFSQVASLVTAAVSGSIPFFPAALLVVMIAGGVAGGLAGGRISKRIHNRQVDRVFLVLLAAIVAVSVYNFVSFSG